MKKVSIIVPVYNVEEYICQCLDSVFAQTYKNIEVIAVYREGDDNTFEHLEKYKENNGLIIIDQFGGLGGARNQGIECATGEYIFFLDSDDWIREDAIEKLVENIEQTNADMVVFPFYSYDNSKDKVLSDRWGSKLTFPSKLTKGTFSIKDLNPKDVISGDALVTAWNKLYSVKFLRDNNILFVENLRFEDNPFYYECLVKANKISCVNDRLLYYRINRNNSIQAASSNNRNGLHIIEILKKVEKVFIDYGDKNLLSCTREYIVQELVWRFHTMTTIAKEFLLMAKDEFLPEIYDEVIKEISHGDNYYKSLKCMPLVENPKVSIIVPVYKVEAYIKDCLISIVNQTLKDIEILIIDDCSPDRSMATPKLWQLKDERIRIYSTDVNSGAGKARNIGLENARGEFISFMDPDDLYCENDTLEKLYQSAIENKANIVCGNMGVIELDYKYGSKAKFVPYNGYFISESRMYKSSEYNTWPSWGFTRFIYKNEFLKELGVTFPETRTYEDPIFLATILSSGQDFYGLEDFVYLYRYVEKERTITYTMVQNTLDGYEKISDLYKEDAVKCISEYRNLIYFFKNDFKKYVFTSNEMEQIKNSKEHANELLKQIESYEIEDLYVYKNIDEILNEKEININSVGSGGSIKKLIKNVAKPIIWPVYKRLMSRVDYRIENAVSWSNNEVNNLNERVALLDQGLEDMKNKFDMEARNILDELNKTNKELRELKNIELENLYFKDKIVLIGTSEHGNIGDAAISLGVYEFIRKYFSDKTFVEFSTYEFENNLALIERIINPDDLIFLQGGGNLGNKYLNEESVRRTIISKFPNNKIVILPQTIYFDDNETGKRELKISADIYNSHNNLTIFTRGKKSLDLAKKSFTNADCYLSLDSALNLSIDFNFERDGILACIRDLEEESGLTKEEYERVFEIIKSKDENYDFTKNNSHDDIYKEKRYDVVYNQLANFARHKLVVTDRLHGLIFSIITHTPCILLSSYNYKMEEAADLIGKNDLYTFIDKDIDSLEAEIDKKLKAKTTKNKEDYASTFEQVAKIIKEEK